MAIFEYKGYDSEGHKVSGSCEGSSQRSVLASLRQKGIFASEVTSTKKTVTAKIFGNDFA